VSAATRSTDGARAIIYSLLLSPDDPTRSGQLHLLQKNLGSATLQQVRDLLPAIDALNAHAKLPLVDLTLPSLRHLDPVEYSRFAQLVRELVEHDQAIDLFEYTLQKTLFRHLQIYYQPTPGGSRLYSSVQSLLPECSVLLSALAHIGQKDETAEAAAFQRGAGYLNAPQGSAQLLSGEDRSLASVDAALDRLTQAAPSVKRNVLLACAQTVAADGQVHHRESELLRAIAAALDCPVPPFVEALKG